jgi:hypothetical protein
VNGWREASKEIPMAKHGVKYDNYFIACGDADGESQATFTDIRDRSTSAVGTEEANAAFVLDGNYSKVMLTLANTGQNLTDFQVLGQVYREGPWHVLITGAGWGTVANILKFYVGALNTLNTGQSAMAYFDPGALYAVKAQAKIANGVRSKGTFTAAANPTNTKASQTLTITVVTDENFADGEEVVIDTTTYTMVDALTEPAVPFEVLIGVDANTSMDNLELAIEAGAGAGTLYGTGTTVHPTVTASVAGDVLTVTAKTPGTGGNAIVVTTDSAEAVWAGAGTLAGGTTETVTIGTKVYTFKAATFLSAANDVLIGANAEATLLNLVNAINGGSGSGTTYHADTVAHTQVTAAEGAGDTIVVTAIYGISAAVGTAIASTETCAQCSWGATTLADAVMTAVSVNMVAAK